MSLRFSRSFAAALAMTACAAPLFARVPAAPGQAQTQGGAPANSSQAGPNAASPNAASPDAASPDAPGAQGTPSTALPPMPPVDPNNFTATTPTVDTVNSFLKASWGYDPARIWQVQAIQKTTVPGLSRVVVLVEEKGSGQQQPSPLSFFVLPDGKHLISDEVLPFGARPYEDYRTLLQKEANGPAQGATSKDLMLVEFADFQCPHCKEAQPIIDRLLKDFPNARYVYENYPLTQIHSEAQKASEYSVCVAKLGGDAAFFKYTNSVYANQTGLTPEGSAKTLDTAVTAAGQDPAKVAACAALPETKAAVAEQLRVGSDVGVNSTPTLFVNGRGLPFAGIPYETLKQIVSYQMQLDGVRATSGNATQASAK
jgi:protein-disulfide isomerase